MLSLIVPAERGGFLGWLYNCTMCSCSASQENSDRDLLSLSHGARHVGESPGFIKDIKFSNVCVSKSGEWIFKSFIILFLSENVFLNILKKYFYTI